MDIIGYTYQAEIYCPKCLFDRMEENTIIPSGIMAMDAEDALDALALAVGIDRHDEQSYDSDEFPKVVFSFDAVADETCGNCGGEL